MNILFDYQAFEMQRFGGVSNSYAEIISHLKAMGVDARMAIKESNNEHLKQIGIATSIKPLGTKHQCWFGSRKLFRGQRRITRTILYPFGCKNDFLTINQDYCIRQIKKQKFDIFEPTFFDSYFLPFLNGKPFVLTVHDMIPELFPQYFARDDFQIVNKKKLCPLATAIHVPSQKTKEDLVNILNINPHKITVIPHGAPHNTVPPLEPQRLIDKPYILFVGERGGYKNFILLLQELAITTQAIPELSLLCTGRPFNDGEQRLIAELRLTDNVHHIYADNEIFYSLYHNSIAFVYPSAYEGFGIPILEAFAYGCPVMLNNASCFPEVGGDAAIYFDINRRGDLAEHLEAFLRSSEQDRTDLITRGRERAKLFSWEDSARKLSHVYKTILA